MFVDGAFWHGHRSRHKPGRSGSYWDEKIARNVERDRQADTALESDGWTVVRIWDFEVARELEGVVERVSAALRERTGDAVRWQRRLGGSKKTQERAVAALDLQSGEGKACSFAHSLREARLRAGLSRRELAQASGVSESTIRLYENGTREPRLGTAVKLAHSLGDAPLSGS